MVEIIGECLKLWHGEIFRDAGYKQIVSALRVCVPSAKLAVDCFVRFEL